MEGEAGDREPDIAVKRFDRLINGEGKTLLPGLYRRARTCPRTRLCRASARPHRNQFARRSEAAAARLCRGASRRALDRRPRLEPGALARQEIPDCRRPRFRRERSAGRARARRRPRDRREQRRDEGGRGHRGRRRSAVRAAASRTASSSTPRRADRQSRAGGDRRRVATRRSPRRRNPARLRRHRRRSMSTAIDDWNAMRRAGEAGRLQVRLMVYLPDELNCCRRRAEADRRGSTATGCAWSASNSTPTARSARAARGSSSLMPTSPTRPASQFHSDAELRALADTAAAHGFQIATHAIGDAANAQVIGTYEWLNGKYGTRPALADRACASRRLRGPAAASGARTSSPRCSRRIRRATG